MDTTPSKPVVRNYAQLAAVALLTVGCLYVLRPFAAAILFAAAIVISTWPLYTMLLARIRGRRTLGAAILTFTLVLLIILPIALVAYNLADDVGRFYDQLRNAVTTGNVHPPEWVRRLPLVGEQIDSYLRQVMSSREQMMDLARRML
ncbi:MAG: AI-2E family transporter, partial [Gammaproteobacteria bacterium]